MSARANIRLAIALCLAAALGALAAAPALAAPQLGLQLLRTDTPLNRGDERLVYELKVKNEATDKPSVGDELTCNSTLPSGNPTPSVDYQWLRSGVAIPGATNPKYTVHGADEGELLQCRVTATNDADGAGSTYAPIATTAVSLPPVAIEPVPSPAALSGGTGPEVSNLKAATPSATATVTAGSELLTDVFTAKGEGTLTAGSDVVTGAKATTGTFEDGQAIVGTGVPPETAISRVTETAPGTFEFTLIEARAFFGIESARPATASGTMSDLRAGALPFAAGQSITGTGIPAGTKVLEATKYGLKGPEVLMSNKATASGTEVAVSGTTELTCTAPSGWSGEGIVWSFRWLRNGTPIPGATNSTYTVQSADTEPPSSLQCEAVGKDAGGSEAVAVSAATLTEPKVPTPHSSPVIAPPTVSFANTTEGPIALELELPAGADTRPVRVIDDEFWDCVKEGPIGAAHGYVKCVRTAPLAPGVSAGTVQAIVSVGQEPPVLLSAKARVSGGNSPEPPVLEDSFEMPEGPRLPFGFKAFSVKVLDEAGSEDTQVAGGHPFSAGATVEFKTHLRPDPIDLPPEAGNGSPKVIRTDLPRGLVGNPEAVSEKCASVDEILKQPSTCPAGSVVGGVQIFTDTVKPEDLPIYALEPEFGQPAEFAFGLASIGLAFALVPELRAEDGYAVTLVSAKVPKAPELLRVVADLCGLGAKTRIDPGNKETKFDGCHKEGEPGALEKPLITNPTRCTATPPTTRISAESWEEPGIFKDA
ncbi:MAG TPA: hypothetical protein VFR04_08845, partial [Solirubrobacterales bacterium]|nr:hypothetical protein [Solirubrobacterales bacterium]